MQDLINAIIKKLQDAGVEATVGSEDGDSIYILAECPTIARDVMGMQRFRDWATLVPTSADSCTEMYEITICQL